MGTKLSKKSIQAAREFHGHSCPGLAIGLRAAEVALQRIGKHSVDEEMVTVTETNMCGVDAIQFLVGCTFGKGNLIHLDYGKNVFTFFNRTSNAAIRVSTKTGSFGRSNPEYDLLKAKRNAGLALAGEEQDQWSEFITQRIEDIMTAQISDLFEVTAVTDPPPPTARIMASIICPGCGEPTMETRARVLGGQTICQPCFEQKLKTD